MPSFILTPLRSQFIFHPGFSCFYMASDGFTGMCLFLLCLLYFPFHFFKKVFLLLSNAQNNAIYILHFWTLSIGHYFFLLLCPDLNWPKLQFLASFDLVLAKTYSSHLSVLDEELLYLTQILLFFTVFVKLWWTDSYHMTIFSLASFLCLHSIISKHISDPLLWP